MRPVFRIMILGVLATLVFAAQTRSAPRPGTIPDAWQLDFKFHDPQRISIRLPGDNADTVVWYVLYEVTNNTGRDVDFFPSFELVTNTLQVVRAESGISPTVYDVIQARHRKEYPFLVPPGRASGLLLQGEGNARATFAVFTTFDAKADSFTLFVSGLSGELASVRNPAYKAKLPESSTNMRAFVLRRTLAIIYDLPGEPETRDRAVPVRRTKEWVMR